MFGSNRAWRNQSRPDALVGDQGLGVRQCLQGRRGAVMVADLPFGCRQHQWLTTHIADSVHLGGLAAFGALDAVGNSPFLPKLVAV
ncbi:MAG: hypothetical protein ACI95R_002938 [Halioglobus sp.]|jgi:hypothetical protein